MILPYGMIDGVINNGRRDEPQGKTSIRERLEAAKKECAGRKAPEATSMLIVRSKRRGKQIC